MANAGFDIGESSTARDWNEPNLAKTGAKRQHYVPQMLLRPFATGGRLRVSDLDDLREFWATPATAAVEQGFYNVARGDDVLSNELWLSELEGVAAPILREITADPDALSTLSDEQDMALARFLTAQRLRVPAFRRWLRGVTDDMLPDIKRLAKGQLFAMTSRKEAEATWAAWEKKPPHFWWGMEREEPPEELTSDLLGEVQGYANLLRAAPWRIGKAAGKVRLYTSDNPVAGDLPTVRPWWEGAAFASLVYYVPLSPQVLLKIGRRPDSQEESVGARESRDFDDYAISVARHVVTAGATRFLFGGEGPIVPRDCARSCLDQAGRANLQHAIRYQGFDPNPPSAPR